MPSPPCWASPSGAGRWVPRLVPAPSLGTRSRIARGRCVISTAASWRLGATAPRTRGPRPLEGPCRELAAVAPAESLRLLPAPGGHRSPSFEVVSESGQRRRERATVSRLHVGGGVAGQLTELGWVGAPPRPPPRHSLRHGKPEPLHG